MPGNDKCLAGDSATAYEFTTADLTKPYVVASSPGPFTHSLNYAAVNVPTDTTVMLVFSEKMRKKSSGQLLTLTPDGAGTSVTAPVDGAVFSDTNVTFTPI